MYQTRLTSLSPPRGERGESLTFIGDFPASVGDVVWTDGHVIFGHFPRYDVPVLSAPQAGVPVWSTSVFVEQGYFTRTGVWRDAALGIPGGLLVNDDRQFFQVFNDVFQEDQLYDATVYDGALYEARKHGRGVRITRDGEVFQDIDPPVEGTSLHDLRFADGLAWSAQGGGFDTNGETVETAVLHFMDTGGYRCVYTDEHPPDYATAYYEFSPPIFTESMRTVRRVTDWSNFYVLTSDGGLTSYEGSEEVYLYGDRVAGAVTTTPIESGHFSDIGYNSLFWSGTCTCTSTFYAFGSFWWFGPEPLENMDIVNYACDEHVVRVNEPVSNREWANYPFRRDLQNGFHVMHGKTSEDIYDADDRLVMTSKFGPERAYRGAYLFKDGSAIVLGPGRQMYRCTGGAAEYVRDVRNLKFNLMHNVKHAKEWRGQG